MDSILNRLKLVGFNLLLIVLISNCGYAFQYSVIKKNENLNGMEKFQQKKNPSMDKFSNTKKKSRFQNSDQQFLNKTIRLETWDKAFFTAWTKESFFLINPIQVLIKHGIKRSENIKISILKSPVGASILQIFIKMQVLIYRKSLKYLMINNLII